MEKRQQKRKTTRNFLSTFEGVFVLVCVGDGDDLPVPGDPAPVPAVPPVRPHRLTRREADGHVDVGESDLALTRGGAVKGEGRIAGDGGVRVAVDAVKVCSK